MNTNNSSQDDQYKKLIENYMSKLSPSEQKVFMDNLMKGQGVEKTPKERLREKIEMARFNRLPKQAKQKIKDKFKDVVDPVPEHSQGEPGCKHNHGVPPNSPN